ncbi:MAG: hypothetical protein IKP76_02615 [Bacilli bacterium]|nr:hypothetical protein [Bacilli bacterium]
MYKDSIVTLDNGFEMYILDDMEFASRRFILGSPVDTAKDEINEEELVLKEVVQEDGTDKFISIDKPEEADSFLKLMLMKIRNEE